MKYSKRLTAVILSFMMIMTMMPAMAFAEGDVSSGAEVSTEIPVKVDPAVQTDDPAAQLEDPSFGTEEDAFAGTDEEALTDDEETLTDDEEYADEGFDDSDYLLLDGSEELEEAEDIPDDADYGEAVLDFGLGIDPEEELEGADPEDQVENFIFGDEEETSEVGKAPEARLSIKGNRLSGKDLVYYNAFKSIVKNVSAAKTSSSKKKLGVAKIAGKRSFTAKQLGVKKIAAKKNGVWYVTDAAQKKIAALLNPKDWKKVYMSAFVDLCNDSYWVDWHTREYFITFSCPYRYTANSITFDSSASITCRLAVQPEFQGSTFKANLTKIKAAKTAKDNAKMLVKTFDDAIPTTFAGYSDPEIDVYRLWNYCRWIAVRNTYNDYAADANYDTLSIKGPWSWVYVFDGDSSTNAVCEGYAIGLKLLCDMSKFKSSWIDCQIVSGKSGSSSDAKHMWNIVRMNDGLNYVVDPTWMDLENEYEVDEAWFLRGDPEGTADSYTIEGYKRVYDSWTKKAFASAERKLSTKSYYEYVQNRKITLKKTAIKKLIRKKKAIGLKWKKVSSPLGALYIDGYQIQYSLKKNFKGAKKLTVKGYNKTSATIKKLKSNKYYYVRVRTFAKMGKKTYFSGWSKKKRVKTK